MTIVRGSPCPRCGFQPPCYLPAGSDSLTWWQRKDRRFGDRVKLHEFVCGFRWPAMGRDDRFLSLLLLTRLQRDFQRMGKWAERDVDFLVDVLRRAAWQEVKDQDVERTA